MSSSQRRPRKRSDAQPSLASGIRTLPGVGEKRERLLSELCLKTVGDLLVYPPRRYIDRASFSSIAELRGGEIQSVIGKVERTEIKPAKGKRLFIVHVEDATGRMRCVWFNQPYLRNVFHQGDTFVFSGTVQVDGFGKSLVHPEYEPMRGELLHTGRLVPVYGTRPGLGQKQLRTLVKSAVDSHLDGAVDHVPGVIRNKLDLIPLKSAVRHLHFPPGATEAEAARRRLAFDEVLLFQTLFALSRLERKGTGSRTRDVHDVIDRFSGDLPFELTGAQVEALGQITADIADRYPMRRLLQGDVGCGKTVVAGLAAAVVCDTGGQVALMCPTEILAEQHYGTLKAFLAPFGFKTGILTGSMPVDEMDRTREALAGGTLNAVVGTHALIGEKTRFEDLELVIVDEEQRFGVLQRTRLVGKAPQANLIVVSATPIPRTLALTAYGDLDVTTIADMPPGRGTHTSHSVASSRRPRVLKEVAAMICGGRQAFHVCPSLEQGEAGLIDVKTVKKEMQALLGKDRRVEVLTGRTERDRRLEIIGGFRANKIGLVVATTVIEVGMDIPAATILVVEQAERFGLSQLHQMRGRVARTSSDSLSYFIVSEAASEKARARIAVLESTFDGFEIAESDLVFRGPGDLVGTRQHGVPDLKFTRLPDDTDLMLRAREEAFERIRGGDTSPEWRMWIDAVTSMTEGRTVVV
ncbi:MAG: ATP-dependent DNA helicase RecG [Candidatus Eisenbacteria bacterium]